MDKISELSDDLLIKILSFLPTKDAVSTSLVSKRWEFLWMWLPKLEFVIMSHERLEEKNLRHFLDRNLPLHRAPAIESFRLNLVHSYFEFRDIKMWVLLAVSHNLRELDILHTFGYCWSRKCILPMNLYTSKSLVTLKLEGDILLDVPRMVCMPSLKTLQLRQVQYLDEGSLPRLLSICPILEDLLLECRDYEYMRMITIIIPSLQSLSIRIPSDGSLKGLVVNTPSLQYFKFEDHNDESHSCLIENMPKLEEAYVDVTLPDIESLVGSISSVKRLTISSEAVYVGGFVFNHLEHLKLCVDTDYDLLVRLLESSPNLRVLDLFEMDPYDMHWKHPQETVHMHPPKTVDKSILSSLKTYNWSGYLGRRPREKDLAVYVLGKRLSFDDCNSLV